MENVSVRQKWIVMTIPNTPTMPLRDAAKVLGIGASTAYAAVRAGTFPVPVIHIGTRIVVPTAPLRELLHLADDEDPADDDNDLDADMPKAAA